jgi:hypothetical protein
MEFDNVKESEKQLTYTCNMKQTQILKNIQIADMELVKNSRLS